MNRGDIVVVAAKGAYTAKPRPALVVQADVFNETHASVTLCPITSDCIDAPLFRVSVPPGPRTGLQAPSQVMVDMIDVNYFYRLATIILAGPECGRGCDWPAAD